MDLSKLFHIFCIVKHFTPLSQLKMMKANAFSITRCGYNHRVLCGYNIRTPFCEKKIPPSFFSAAKFGVLLA
jgi:hypothetical protein